MMGSPSLYLSQPLFCGPSPFTLLTLACPSFPKCLSSHPVPAILTISPMCVSPAVVPFTSTHDRGSSMTRKYLYLFSGILLAIHAHSCWKIGQFRSLALCLSILQLVQ